MKKILLLTLCICLLAGTLGFYAWAADGQSTSADASQAQDSAEQESTTSGFTATTSPLKATYVFINTAMGYGSGTLYLDMPEQSNATSFAAYWGDAAGSRLADHTPFITGEITSQNVTRDPTEGFSIPIGASTILVYTYSAEFGESTTPYKIDIGSYTLPETGKLVTELVIVSDLHIGSGKTAEKNLTAMLKDVIATAPNAAGIVVTGDAVEAAEEEYYLALRELCSSVEGAPAVYLGVGDRSYLTKDTYLYDPDKHAQNLQLFLKYAGHPFDVKLDKPYYSYVLGGTLLIFIGADSYQYGNAVYSEEQLAWLDTTLAGTDKYEAVLLIMHEPLPNTVSGSLTDQGYGNVLNHQDLKDILKKYNNLSIFSGHTQWALEADRTMSYLSAGARIFNTAGVSHLWGDDKCEIAGSQGYYVTVYEDAVLVRGRDFTTGEWISTAIYMSSTKPLSVQTQAPVTQAPTTPSATKPAEQTTEAAAEEESGLSDLIAPLCILAGMTVVVFIIVFRKPKDQP